jgi:Rieske Fe-S protein
MSTQKKLFLIQGIINKKLLFSKPVLLSPAGASKVLVCSALCTHLGCIPIPYLGSYNVYSFEKYFIGLGLYLSWISLR